MKTKLKVWTKKHVNSTITTFVGRIGIYNGNQYLYSHSCGINRLTKVDAIKDAKILKEELLKKNMMKVIDLNTKDSKQGAIQ